MERKIVFFDIDGTIYKFTGGMPNDTKEAIIQLKKNGHIPVICTGRTRCMIYKEHLAPGFTNIVGGAGTYIEIENKQTYLAELEEVEARRIIEGFLRNHFVPVAEGRDCIYLGTDHSDLPKENKLFIDVYKEKIPDRIHTIDEQHIKVSKISGAFTHHSNLENMMLEFGKDYTIVNHNNNLLELIPKGFNKAKGIEKMIGQMGISREDTYAFGDSENDLDMLEYVKYGCAMGNSDESIKQRVDYITEDYDKGGIVNALRRFELI